MYNKRKEEPTRPWWAKIDNRRLGNIELQWTNYGHFDVVKYYPNALYGKEGEYEYDERNDVYRPKNEPHYIVSASCFKHKECRFVIAYIEPYDEEKGEYPDIITVGPRTVELNDQEWVDYHNVLKYFYDSLDKLRKEDNDDDRYWNN